MNKLSLFSGIGGIDLAAEWAGMKTVAFCEREPFPQKVLKKHWPNVPIYDDVCELTAERLREDGIIGTDRTIDIISAGYPCQPESFAGKRKGKDDDRWLWPEVRRLIKEIRPRWFVGENVFGHVSMGLDTVLSDLENDNYTTEAIVIPAAAVGAPHRRDRVIVLGYTERSGCGRESWGRTGEVVKNGHCELEERIMGYTSGSGLPEWGQSRISTSGTEAEPGMEPEPERSSEDVANSNSLRYMEGEFKKHSAEIWEQSQSGFAISDKNVANPSSSGQQECNPPTISDRSRHGSRSAIERGANGSIEPGLGGVLDGLSGWLDGYNWPAGLGAEQYDWEPPRVATGVKDRVGRLKALGNAVNPVQIYPVLLALKAIDETITMYRWGLNE